MFEKLFSFSRIKDGSSVEITSFAEKHLKKKSRWSIFIKVYDTGKRLA